MYIYTLPGVRAGATSVHSGASEYHAACPRYEEVLAEAERREKIDSNERAAEAAVKKAAEDAKEKLKADFIAAWFADPTHADEITRQQFTDGLLGRGTAISLIARSVLDPLGAKYEPDFCNDSSCPCGRKDVDCLPRDTYPSWLALKAKLPAGTVTEFESVRECLRDEDGYAEDGDGAGPKQSAVNLKVPFGPFVFERLVRLNPGG